MAQSQINYSIYVTQSQSILVVFGGNRPRGSDTLFEYAIIKEAIDCSIINRLSFWDSLIVTAAESAQCEILWTEDLNDGQIVRSVRIVNPLIIES